MRMCAESSPKARRGLHPGPYRALPGLYVRANGEGDLPPCAARRRRSGVISAAPAHPHRAMERRRGVRSEAEPLRNHHIDFGRS